MPDETETDRPLPAAAAAALSLGRMVDAIRHVREAEGLGLMEAKLRVEAHIRQDPALKAQFEEQQAQMKRRVIRWALVIDAIIIAAVLWWFLGR
jgi:ribosomal protein L7/L12